jgi:hypothetical protein
MSIQWIKKLLINRKGLFSVFYLTSEKSSHSDIDIRKHKVFDAIRIGLIRLKQGRMRPAREHVQNLIRT